MEKKNIAEDMKTKYLKVDEVTDFRDLLFRSARKYKTKTAFKLKDTNGNIYKVTYEEFKNDVIAFGTALIENGLKNKTIAVMGKNSYQWAVSYLAASIVGIVVPIDKELHVDDVINFLNASDCSLLISDEKYLKDVRDNVEKLNSKETNFIVMNNKKNSDLIDFETLKSKGSVAVKNGNAKFENIKIDPNELRILLFTSGTTGNSKGVCLSQNNIISNILSTSSIVKVTSKDRVLSILPLHHTYECTLGFLLVIYSGGCISYCEGLKYISKNILEFKPTILLCVPLLLENIYKKIYKSLKDALPEKSFDGNKILFNEIPWFKRVIIKKKIKLTMGGKLSKFIVGAAAVNPNVIDTFFELGIPAIQGYGLTECSPLVTGNNDHYHKADSCGLPIPNVQFKIDTPDTSGCGEILVKGPNVMLGYYKMPEETAKVIQDGWFHTGDLGYINEDGYLHITGRCKTVIVTQNGKNIYPEELEYYLNENPFVSESLVIGYTKDNDSETYINAQIVPNADAIKEYLKNQVPTKADVQKIIDNIIKNVNSKLPNYKHIKKVTIREEEFEKTTTKKIKRFGRNVEIKAN